MPKWTNEQQLAIDKEGTNIIVSAGAGSGKTAVLTARVIRKLNNGVDIDKLLILTFTNAAAKEMKERIRSAIKKAPDLSSQLDLIDGAYITTFDSYSLSLVKKYYYLLGVDRNVNIADSSVIYTEKSRIIDEIFDSLYEEEDPNFLKLIGDFCVKNDDDIKKYILSISDKMDLIYDKYQYLDTYMDKFYNEEFIDSNINKYVSSILSKREKISELVEELSNYLDSDYLEKLSDVLTPLLNADSYDELKNSLEFRLPPLPRNSDDDVKERKEEISKEIKSLKELSIYDDVTSMKDGILKTKPYLEAIISIIRELTSRLDKFKSRNNVFEFNDISKMAIKILKENDDVCSEIRNGFQEIMVDEYQDTSDLQEEFIGLIENNNVYMVGDIKQSIYRFRNANPYIFKNKYDKYSVEDGGFKIDLNKNFRSRKETLDNINTVFNIVMDDKIGGADYTKSHQMVFGNNVYFEEGNTTQDENFEIYNYKYDKSIGFTKAEVECFIVATDIKKKISDHYQVFDKDLGILRDCKYSDFVVLMDRASEFDLYKKIFEYMNIPLTKYTYTSITGNNDLLIIKNLIGLMIKYHNREFDIDFKYNFSSIARSYLFNYPDSLIFDYFKNGNYSDSEIIKILDDIETDYDSLSIRSLILKLISSFKFYEKLITVGSIQNSIVRLEYIYNLAGNAEEMDYSVEDFLEYLNKLVDDDFDIKVEINDVNPNSVGIMTIHKSKGLEYPICYYTGISSSFNIRDTMERFIFDNEYGVICPYFNEGINKTIYNYLFREKYIREDISERIRLFYVALTRCREKMILVGEVENKTINKSDSKLNYRSFLDIINSVYSSIADYIVDIPISSIPLSKDYNLATALDYKKLIPKSDCVVKVDNISIENNTIEEKKFSKVSPSLLLSSTRDKMELGRKIHHYLECIDFLNPDFTNVDKRYVPYIKQFLESEIDFNNCTIYKEYEFMYNDGCNSGHGIIDLMLVYDDHIQIIDYKLNNIVDEAYKNQLTAYREYIQSKTNKTVTTYLYSVFTGVLKEV